MKYCLNMKEIKEKNKMKYRKKPVVIEAFQMTEERRWNNVDWPEWFTKHGTCPILQRVHCVSILTTLQKRNSLLALLKGYIALLGEIGLFKESRVRYMPVSPTSLNKRMS